MGCRKHGVSVCAKQLTSRSNCSLWSLGQPKRRAYLSAPVRGVMHLNDMKKLYILILSTFIGSGCSIILTANLKNESQNGIFIVESPNKDMAWHIRSNTKVEITWAYRCLTVVESGSEIYFDPWPIPENTMNNRAFSSSINVLYRNQQLSFIQNNSNLVPLTKLTECPNA